MMRGKDFAHTLNLKDINSTWSETRTGGDGNKYEVFIAICSCGHQMEGLEVSDMAALFSRHVESQ